MTHLRRLFEHWKQDRLLGKVIRNSGYLVSSNTISMGLGSLQGLLAAAMLGAESYGVLGIIISFASNVNRLLSFRMNELVVKYGGQYLAEQRKDRAAAVVKIAGMSEAVTSVVAYAILILLARWGAATIVKDPGTAVWIIIYGMALLANLVTETSTAVLQIGGHFRTQAVLNLAQNILTFGWILIAFLLKGSLTDVILAYLSGKFLFGMGIAAAAIYWSRPMFGEKWWRAKLNSLPDFRKMVGFAISTNLSGTANMVFRDSEILWIGFFLSSLEAGYYKFALAIMNVVILPILPFIQTTFPEITRTVTLRLWKPLRSLLQRTSLIALAWTVITGLGIFVLGPWFLRIFKSGDYLPAFGVILILFAGYSFANIFYWNRPLMLAFGRPNFPLTISVIFGLLKTGLMILLVRQFGMMMQAGLLSGYFIVSIAIIMLTGLFQIQRSQSADQLLEAAA
jgi:O-antigen/teichoic acid export membrane protein